MSVFSTEKPAPPVSLSLSPRDAARALGIGARTLWTLTARGEIPAVRVGRRVIYDVEVLKAWLASKSTRKVPS